MNNFVFPLVLSLFVTILTGYFSVSLIDRELELRFRIILSVPMGFGIHSILYFLYQCLNIYDFHKYYLFEFIIAIVLALFYYNQERPDFSKHKFKRLNNWFYVLNIYAISIFLQYFLINPMGHWDGFRIWNTKAQFLIIQSPEWQNIFRLPDFLSHCDYPLFLPSSVARIWMYLGGENYYSNVILGAVFTFTIVYMLYQALSYFKNERIALITTSVLLCSNIFLYNGANQCADIPLSLYFLSSVVCLFLYFKTKRFSILVLSAMFAGLSGWVKNEGLMFIAVFTLVLFGYFLYKRSYKAIITLVCSVFPFMIFFLWFKNLANIPNDIIWGISQKNTLNFLFDTKRYVVLLKSYINMLLHPFALFLSLLILGLKGFKVKNKIKIPYWLSVSILVLMVLGYVIVYVASPHDISWLVENSLMRIMLQILPLFLLIFSLSLRIGKPDTLN